MSYQQVEPILPQGSAIFTAPNLHTNNQETLNVRHFGFKFLYFTFNSSILY
jgi:hypothetical protein